MKMKATQQFFNLSLLSLAIASTAYAQDGVVEEEIVVTGYKGSLQSAAIAKRESTALVESVFAEDIGKFADSNIAEAMNRMPGVQINRDPFGQGVNVSVRGLGTSFTKVLLNGAQFSVATTGTIDTQNQNREVDLDLFPTELFSRFDIQKTPTAAALEGGVSGIVNIRAARPFDFDEGVHTNVKLEDTYTELESTHSPNGVVLSSWRNESFGVLGGISYSDRALVASGYETIGYSNIDISNRLCDPTMDGRNGGSTSATCNPSGSNNWGIPNMVRASSDVNIPVPANVGHGTVPNNVGAGLPSGAIIDQAFLLAQNPGLNMTQIGEALMPRLGRFANMDGNNERTTGLVSFEYRPSDTMEFYLDTLVSKEDMEVTRLAMSLVGRNGAMIPTKMVLDENNVVQSGTFGHVRFHQENRFYME
jgi:TonB-dependent receptor